MGNNQVIKFLHRTPTDVDTKLPTKLATNITIAAIDPPGPTVRCKHGGGVSTYTSQSGWQFTKLPRTQSMTEFMGNDGYTMVVPVMFGDGMSTRSIEPELEVLRGIARNRVGPRLEPAVVEIKCPTVPLTWLKYVINDMKFNTEYRNDDGSRYYAQVDITFFEWKPTSLLQTKTGLSATQLLSNLTSYVSTPSISPNGITIGAPVNLYPGLSNPSGGFQWAGVPYPPSTAVWVVRKGDTLQTIALAVLGNANQWTRIANMNTAEPPYFAGKIRDPKSIIVGQILRLPKGSNKPVDPNLIVQQAYTSFYNASRLP